MKLFTSRPRSGITDGPASTASISLTRVGVGALLVGWEAMTAVALFGFNAARRPVEPLQEAYHHATFEALAARISGRLARIQVTLGGFSADPTLVKSAQSGVIPPPWRVRLAECRGTLDTLCVLARTRCRENAAANATAAHPTGVVQGD